MAIPAMFDVMVSVGRKLRNAAINLINLVQNLFFYTLAVAAILICGFYGFPIVPIIAYGVVAALVGYCAFSAARLTVDAIASLFEEPKADTVTAALNEVQQPQAEPSSTAKMAHSLGKTPAAEMPKETVNAAPSVTPRTVVAASNDDKKEEAVTAGTHFIF